MTTYKTLRLLLNVIHQSLVCYLLDGRGDRGHCYSGNACRTNGDCLQDADEAFETDGYGG